MNETKLEILKGHTSPETAYVVSDYPYGFRLRCKIRYWLEYRKGKGFRICSQTTNPKVAGEKWNAPKMSTYTELAVMVLHPPNEKGIREVSWIGLNVYNLQENFDNFVTNFADGLTEEPHLSLVQGYRDAIARYNARKEAQAIKNA